MDKPKLLDTFCCAGGCSEGYRRAGFEPYGIDIKPQPHYPFPFLQMDALEALDRLIKGEALTFTDSHPPYLNEETLDLTDFAAIHASPPCQHDSVMTKRHGQTVVDSHPQLIEPTRERLVKIGKPYVIENVPGAPLIEPIMLCGSMFGLRSGGYGLRKHRHFESNITLFAPASCNHEGQALPVYGHAGGSSKRDGLKFPGTAAWREAMQTDWMVGDEMAEANPPAYTEFIGRFLIKCI